MSIEKQIANIPNLTKADRVQTRLNAERWLEKGTAAQKAQAMMMIEALDAHEAQLTATGAAEKKAMLAAIQKETGSLGLGPRLLRAFTEVPLTPTDVKVIQVLLDNPDATDKQLSTAIGWDGGWDLHFAHVGKERAAYLPPPPMSVARKGEPFWCGLLSDFDFKTRGFTMKPDVVEVLAHFGLRPGNGDQA